MNSLMLMFFSPACALAIFSKLIGMLTEIFALVVPLAGRPTDAFFFLPDFDCLLIESVLIVLRCYRKQKKDCCIFFLPEL